MSKKLFVGGLSWDTTDQSLRAAFEAYGAVREARVILDRDTGRSRGFGFVSYDDDAAALDAIEKMNGAMLDGRTIRVNEAEERRGPGGGGGPRGPGGPRRSFDRDRGPEVHTRGRPMGGAPGGPPRGGPPRGFAPPPPAFDPGPPGGDAWDERERRDINKKRKKKTTTPSQEDEFRMRAAQAKKRRRESGRTWRDYDLEDDAFDDVIED